MRGNHAHKKTHQFVVCLAGMIKAMLWDRDGKRSFTLNSPAAGLYVPPMTWLTLVNQSAATVCLVLASTAYEDVDYIRDKDDFVKLMIAE